MTIDSESEKYNEMRETLKSEAKDQFDLQFIVLCDIRHLLVQLNSVLDKVTGAPGKCNSFNVHVENQPE